MIAQLVSPSMHISTDTAGATEMPPVSPILCLVHYSNTSTDICCSHSLRDNTGVHSKRPHSVHSAVEKKHFYVCCSCKYIVPSSNTMVWDNSAIRVVPISHSASICSSIEDNVDIGSGTCQRCSIIKSTVFNVCDEARTSW